MDVFWGTSQNWTIFRGHFYAFFGSFFKVKVQNGVYFGVAKISNIFGVLEIPVFFCFFFVFFLFFKFFFVFFWGGGVIGRCWARA